MDDGVSKSSHSKATIVVVVVLIIIAVAAIASYYFYKKRGQPMVPTDNFENSLYFNSSSASGTHDTKDLVSNMEHNEFASI